MAIALVQAGLNLFVAACLGAAIGLERQWRQHLAGLRTNTLVALGAAIFITYARAASDNEGATRIAAQVVSGIGFLGAGVIFKEGLNVRGLNTAATLWCSAAVGLLAGEGLALYGLVAAILVIAANTLLRPIVRAINRQPVEMSEEEQRYVISIECRAPRSSEIRADLVQEVGAVPELNFSQVDSAFIAETGRVEVTATVTSHKRRELELEAIVGRVADMGGGARASWLADQAGARVISRGARSPSSPAIGSASSPGSAARPTVAGCSSAICGSATRCAAGGSDQSSWAGARSGRSSAAATRPGSTRSVSRPPASTASSAMRCSANWTIRPATSASSSRSGWAGPAHKFTRMNDFSGLSALSRNFFASPSGFFATTLRPRPAKAPFAVGEFGEGLDSVSFLTDRAHQARRSAAHL